MSKKMKEVLDLVQPDVLSEEAKAEILTAFEAAVAEQVKEHVELEVENAIVKLDEEHAVQLEKLLKAIDADHSEKLQRLLETIDTDHCKKLQYILDRQKALLTEDAQQFKDQLVTQLKSYLGLFLDKAVPKADIVEAVQNKQARLKLEQMRSMLSIDDDFVNESIQSAMTESKTELEGLKEELNENLKENIKLSQEVKAVKAELLIERATVNFPKEKRDRISQTLKGKDPEYITENLDYVVKMYDRDQEMLQEKVADAGKKESKTLSAKLDVPPSVVKNNEMLNEGVGVGKDTRVSEYVDGLKKQDGKK